jgi:hypothetical protein
MNQPTVNNVGIRWGHDATGTFNYVVRLGLPQLERGLKARDIIRTKGTLVSVYQSPTNIITQGGDFIVSRNTGATRVGPNGLIETGNTNLALQSQAFDVSGTWATVTGGTGVTPLVTANAGVAPDGTTTADRIELNVASGTLVSDASILNQLFTASAITYTFSVWLKSNTGTNQFISLRFNSAPSQNITITSQWQRFVFSGTSDAGSRGFGFDLRGNNPSGQKTADFLAWGAQLEAGSIASEYIPTTTVARTRFAGVTVDGTIAANIPRIDWLGQSCPALLVEPSAQNLFLQSAGFQVSGNWSPINTTVTTGSTAAFTAPDNSTDADLITATTSTSTYIGQNITIASGTYTISVFAKAGNYGLFRIGNVLSADRAAWFDLNAGVVTGTVNGGTASMQNYGNGWYRCIYTSPTMVSGNTFFAPSDAPNSTNSVIGSSIYLWGAQLETGANATSYIPTTSGTGSRAADVISASGALVSGLIGQTEGTMYFEVSDIKGVITGTGNPALMIRNSAFTNWIGLTSNSIAAPFRITVRSTTTTLINYTSAISEGKVAIAYSANGAVVYVNGSEVASTATNPNLTLNIVAMEQYMPFKVESLALYTTRLSNDQLQRLTSFYKPEYDNINLWNAFTQRYSNPDPCLYNRLCALLY